MRSNDRLVVCPECDDLIVEDEWHVHERECRPRRLVDFNDDELMDWVQDHARRDPEWFKKHELIRSWAERAVDQWRVSLIGQPPMQFIQPKPPTLTQTVSITGTKLALAPPYSGPVGPQASFDFMKSAVITTIRARLPNVPLKREEAIALVMEQIYEQWEDD